MQNGQMLIYWYGTPIGQDIKMIDFLSEEQFEGLLRLYNQYVANQFPRVKFDKIINVDNELVGYGSIFKYEDNVFVNNNDLPAIKIFIEDMFYSFRQEYKIRLYRDRTGNFLKDVQTIVSTERYLYLHNQVK